MNLYDIDGTLLAVVLLASLVVAMQVGHVLGRRLEPELRERIAGHVNLIQGSVLGLMALLLGFTFSLSLQRFDSRSEAAVNEANAIAPSTCARSCCPPRSATRSRNRCAPSSICAFKWSPLP